MNGQTESLAALIADGADVNVQNKVCYTYISLSMHELVYIIAFPLTFDKEAALVFQC